MPKQLSIFLLTALIASAPHAQAKVYKWVTPDGTVVYSDQPHPNAEVLNIEPLHPYKAPAYQAPEAEESAPQTSVETTAKYSSVTIDSPEHDTNIHGTGGSFSVNVSSNPPLKSGDKYQLLIDGSATGAPTSHSQFNVQNVNRGTHSLSVQILNKQGKSILQSPAITIHVHRAQVKRKQPR
ncbi:DUF4124 domain-containing protein [Litoribacillus peritrichatus]